MCSPMHPQQYLYHHLQKHHMLASVYQMQPYHLLILLHLVSVHIVNQRQQLLRWLTAISCAVQSHRPAAQYLLVAQGCSYNDHLKRNPLDPVGTLLAQAIHRSTCLQLVLRSSYITLITSWIVIIVIVLITVIVTWVCIYPKGFPVKARCCDSFV